MTITKKQMFSTSDILLVREVRFLINFATLMLCLSLSACNRPTSHQMQEQKNQEDGLTEFQRAIQLSEEGRLGEAEALLRDLLREDDEDVSAMVGLAWVEQKREDYDSAREWLLKAQAIAPDYSDVYHQQYFIYEASGETEKMIDALLSLVQWKWGISAKNDYTEVFDRLAADSDYAIASMQERMRTDTLGFDWKLLLGMFCEHQGMEDQLTDSIGIVLPRVISHGGTGLRNGTGVLRQEELDIRHFRYNKPINGFTVTIDWSPETEDAEFLFTKGGKSFSIRYYSFDPYSFEMPADEMEFTLRYRPKPSGIVLYAKEPFFFSDVDFDGEDELLFTHLLEGPRGANAFTVYELDGVEREDEPFDSFSDWTDFSFSEKAIIQNYYWGVLIGGARIKYRRHQDGSFAKTDSTFIEYTFKGDELVDSIRMHYRRVGDKMVLVKKEVVR